MNDESFESLEKLKFQISWKMKVANVLKHFSVPKIASPEARKTLIVKCIETYFIAPKIASPEARKTIYIENVQGHVSKNPGS